MNDEKFEKFFKAIKVLGFVAPLITPKSQLRQFNELETARAELSAFATQEQIKEIEAAAYAYAITTLDSNHAVTLALMYEAYNVFASGGNYEQAIARVKKYSA